MNRSSFRFYKLLFAIAILAASGPVPAQSWGPLTLEELKQETQLRADRNRPPIGGIKSEDARQALALLTSLEPDDWAAAWSSNGERYMARARELEKTSPQETAK